jgi:tRNA uridine 5-carbamoylmethylation protein Kti12
MPTLQEAITIRRREKRDLKIIITARNSQTGTGKTTLALHIAKRLIDKNWKAERSCFDIHRYIKLYDNSPEGSCIVWDEAEHGADNRRSNSNSNLGFSHAWAMLRYRQIFTIATLPSPGMLDKRMLELADYHIVVLKRGIAAVKEITIDDLSGKIYQRTVQTIRWGSLDDYEEYQIMCDMKHEFTSKYFGKKAKSPDEVIKELEQELKQKERDNKAAIEEKEKEMRRAVDEAVKEIEMKFIKYLHEEDKLSMQKIADIVDRSPATIHKRVKELREEKNENLVSIHSFAEVTA